MSEESREHLSKLNSCFDEKLLILGVDRLDYIKGIPLKIAAFSTFLETHKEYIGRVVLVQIAIPTRTQVDKYRELKSIVDELVGSVNGKYGISSIHKKSSLDIFQ